MPLALAQAIPNQVINEGASFKPFDFKSFIQNPSNMLQFQAELSDGRALPQGLICTRDGILSGIPAKGTEGNYVVVLKIEDIDGDALAVQFNLTIRPVNVESPQSLLRDLKNKVWEAVGKGEPLPTLSLDDLFKQPASSLEVYHLLERFAYLTIWDAYSLDRSGKLVPITLKGASDQYIIYDRGSSLIGAPRDLYTYERTPYDAWITARAMADEAFKRGWTVEFSGFDKMARAAWVRLQVLAAKEGRDLKVLHFHPVLADLVILEKEKEAEFGSKPTP